MSDYKNILVVLDPEHEQQPSLERAALMAASEGVRLTVFASIYDFSYEMTTMLSGDEREAMRRGVLRERQRWIDELIRPLQDKGLNVESQLVWHNRPYESIVRQTLNGGHDLVIKSTHHHPRLKAVIFTPTDWHLLRKCPAPVLLVKEHDWPQGGKILAAINCGSEDEAHIELNHTITRVGQRLASQFGAQLHIVTAYPGTPVNVAIELPEFDPQAYNRSMREHHQAAVAKHAGEYLIPHSCQHVEEGLAEDVIPRVASGIDAELVILGTVGRTGISAALIGNTAEHVIDQLECDLLALKPGDFISPLSA